MSISIHIQRLVLLAAVLLLTACTNRVSSFVAAPQQADKGSVVYIYRPSSSANFMMSPKVVIDDSERFRIASGDYRYVYLQNGEHSIGLDPTDQYFTEAAIAVTIEADKNYYLRVSTSLKFETDSMNTRKFWIDVIEEQQALAEIGDTEYAGPKVQQSSTELTEEPDHEQGFSVDKTQDPFAGKYQ